MDVTNNFEDNEKNKQGEEKDLKSESETENFTKETSNDDDIAATDFIEPLPPEAPDSSEMKDEKDKANLSGDSDGMLLIVKAHYF